MEWLCEYDMVKHVRQVVADLGEVGGDVDRMNCCAQVVLVITPGDLMSTIIYTVP